MYDAIYLIVPSKKIIIDQDLDPYLPDGRPDPNIKLIGVNKNFRSRQELINLAKAIASRGRYSFDEKEALGLWKAQDDQADYHDSRR